MAVCNSIKFYCSVTFACPHTHDDDDEIASRNVHRANGCLFDLISSAVYLFLFLIARFLFVILFRSPVRSSTVAARTMPKSQHRIVFNSIFIGCHNIWAMCRSRFFFLWSICKFPYFVTFHCARSNETNNRVANRINATQKKESQRSNSGDEKFCPEFVANECE